MHRFKRLKLLLEPSVLSGCICVAITVIVLGAAAWSYIDEKFLLYNYFFGVEGVMTLYLSDSSTFARINALLSDGSLAYFLLLVFAAGVVGAVVYGLIESARGAAEETTVLKRELHFYPARGRQMARVDVERVIIRIMSLFFWIVYVLLLMTIIMPATIAMLRDGLYDVTHAAYAGYLWIALSVVVMALSLHVNVIFARLAMLRLRLFGSSDVEIG